MTDHLPVLWKSSSKEVVPQNANTPAAIAKYAVQLRNRDISQIVSAFSNAHYEMASTFVWSRAISALKKQLATMGSEFIGEMLQRPDINVGSDVVSAVTPSEAITLAEDLGMITSTNAMRLRHAHETINHFSEYDSDSDADDEDGMSHEEALICLRACVNSILGQPQLEVAQDFAKFRKQLEERTLLRGIQRLLGY